MDKKSGIYSYWCDTCGKSYIGQTAREAKCRWDEHMSDVKNKNENNAIAKHFIDQPNHVYNDKNFKLIKHVTKDNLLNAWESLYINKYKDTILNIKSPPLESDLFKYCL